MRYYEITRACRIVLPDEGEIKGPGIVSLTKEGAAFLRRILGPKGLVEAQTEPAEVPESPESPEYPEESAEE